MSHSLEDQSKFSEFSENSEAAFDILSELKLETYVLRLYVANSTPRSVRAIQQLKKICEQYLQGRYELEVIDIYQQPELLEEDQVFASPTLIKKLPLPLQRLIGDMTDTEKLIVCLDL
jgi:circadian clock protein KaiB